GVGFAVDTSGNAFKTTPEGWEDIGVVNAQVKFYDVYAGENEEVYIAAGDGRVYRYDDSYNDWTPIGVTDETSMRSIDVYEQDGERQMVVLGNNGSVFQRDDGDRWEEIPSPTSAALFDLSLGSPDIAVGKAGTVIERPRGTTRDAGSSPDGDEFDGRGENDDGDQYGSDEDGSTSENGTTDGTAGDDPTEDDTADDTTEDEQTADDEESRSDEEIIAEIVDLLQELSDGDDDDLSLSDLFS
ncbi:WD40/YVTN/BNR-like repeat-containing protein, partial [Halolamina litorea]